MEKQSQFGIKRHAQLQSIEGRNFEFQPEHLLCGKCWDESDSAFAMACYYGASTSTTRELSKDLTCDESHSMTVTKLSHKHPTTRFPKSETVGA